MSPLEQSLSRINVRINRWRAAEFARFGVAGVLLCWALLALADLRLRPPDAGRVALSVILVLCAAAAMMLTRQILSRRRSPAAVAALLEQHFPRLDNHLINHVLFAADSAADSPWLRAYLADGVPGWTDLPLAAELKDRRRRRFGAAALAAAILLLAAPGLLYGPAWLVALQRVANPFSKLAPTTFARVIVVAPGNAAILQGSAVDLTVRATGRAGQTVTLDYLPSDDSRTVIGLGSFAATGVEQSFVHRVPRLVAPASYRFTVGDARPTERFTVTTVPPLAIATLDVAVTPPSYTRLVPVSADALRENPAIPVNSAVSVTLALNRGTQRAALAIDEGTALEMTDGGDGRIWRGSLNIASGTVMRLTAGDGGLDRLAHNLSFSVIPDDPPVIRVTAPVGRAALPPGVQPLITFEISDDYGIDSVRLEKIGSGAAPGTPGAEIARWTSGGETAFGGQWVGSLADLDGAAHFRLVAEDLREPAPANSSASPPINFAPALVTEQYKEHVVQKGAAQKSFGQLVAWQRANLVNTDKLADSLPAFDPAAWTALRTRQAEIRGYAGDLLRASSAVLGTTRVVLEKSLDPMDDAVAQLGAVTAAVPDDRAAAAAEALNTQKLILRLLSLAQDEARGSGLAQSSSGMLAMIEALLKGQTAVRAATEAAVAAGAAVPETAVERQGALALDMAEVIEMARREAAMAKEGDVLRDLMNTLADKAEELAVKTDMLRAAQALQSNQPAQALPPQTGAVSSLEILRRLLMDWKADDTGKQIENALEIIRDSREAIKKLEKLQEGVVDALRATESQGNKTIAEDEELVEEIAELKKLMADAMLKVATDLQALPELDAANELVTDCYQIYEAMEQVAGSEKNTEATELGLQKEDGYLEKMAKTGEKLDEMEHWLANKPDDVKRNVENFDQAEVQSAIPVIGMPEELQDLIGDLLEEQEELAEKTDDSMTNQGDANPAVGWEIAEGETVSYSAAGKSGNRRPDHKDQDGRSQVGRAGMSDGEVMAKSGRINEGDEEIDARRTRDSSQSGQVEEEGHSEAKATGGGKNSGYADEKGMAGTEADVRRDSRAKQMGEEVRQADLARLADAVYARAQLNGLRIPPGFNQAREDMRRAAEAGRAGNIAQMREFQNRAIQNLAVAQTSLDAGFSGAAMGAVSADPGGTGGAVASSPDEAPAEYRDMVSDYFKAIGEMR